MTGFPVVAEATGAVTGMSHLARPWHDIDGPVPVDAAATAPPTTVRTARVPQGPACCIRHPGPMPPRAAVTRQTVTRSRALNRRPALCESRRLRALCAAPATRSRPVICATTRCSPMVGSSSRISASRMQSASMYPRWGVGEVRRGSARSGITVAGCGAGTTFRLGGPRAGWMTAQSPRSPHSWGRHRARQGALPVRPPSHHNIR